MNEQYYVVCIFAAFGFGLTLALIGTMWLKTQLFFQRAYVEVEGEFIDEVLNIFKVERILGEKERVDVNLIGNLIYVE